MNIFKKLQAKVKIKRAIALADESHAKDGQRYYVMPTAEGKLIVMNRKSFRKLKLKKYISYKAMVADLEKESFYHTPYGNGTGAITDDTFKRKQKEYMFWYANK